MVPPQFTALQRPLPVPTDRKRNIGRTRLHLLDVSAEPLRKEFRAILLLPCTGRQLSGRRMGARTGFRHRVRFINFTTFSRQSQREETATIPKKQDLFLCTLPWTSVCKRWNVCIGWIYDDIQATGRAKPVQYPKTLHPLTYPTPSISIPPLQCNFKRLMPAISVIKTW